jgi:hypothetical protein
VNKLLLCWFKLGDGLYVLIPSYPLPERGCPLWVVPIKQTRGRYTLCSAIHCAEGAWRVRKGDFWEVRLKARRARAMRASDSARRGAACAEWMQELQTSWCASCCLRKGWWNRFEEGPYISFRMIRMRRAPRAASKAARYSACMCSAGGDTVACRLLT